MFSGVIAIAGGTWRGSLALQRTATGSEVQAGFHSSRLAHFNPSSLSTFCTTTTNADIVAAACHVSVFAARFQRTITTTLAPILRRHRYRAADDVPIERL